MEYWSNGVMGRKKANENKKYRSGEPVF